MNFFLVCNANNHYEFSYLNTNTNKILDLISKYNSSNLNGYVTPIVYNGNQINLILIFTYLVLKMLIQIVFLVIKVIFIIILLVFWLCLFKRQ